MTGSRLVAGCLGFGLALMAANSSAQQQPAALVEYAAGLADTTIQETSFVFPGQRIELGEEGQITLTYFANCREETIDGGSLVVRQAGSDLQGAARMDSRIISCLDLNTRLAVATGNGQLNRWKEWVIKTYEPVFQLPVRPPGGFILRLTLLEGEKPAEVWQTPATGLLIRYPSRAVLLESGMPYGVELLDATGVVTARAVFSVDHDLDVTANGSNSLVPLSPLIAPPPLQDAH